MENRRMRKISGSTDRTRVDIILIPGFGTPAADSWPFASAQWLSRMLPTKAPAARTMTFDFRVPLHDAFSWQHVLLEGGYLLKALSDLQRDDTSIETQPRPMLFVCHSLGGIVLKQAFCIANEQLYNYEHLISQVSGIIFLGTPHRMTNQEATLERVMKVLKATTKLSPKLSIDRSREESEILFDIFIRFEGLHLRAPILSAYETKESVVQERRWAKNLRDVLVDKTFCTTHAPLETFIALPFNHIKACNFEDSAREFQEVTHFISEVLECADESIAKRLEAMNVQYMRSSAYSPKASDPSIISYERITEAHNERRQKSQVMEGETSLVTEQGSSVPSQGFEFVPAVSSFSSPRREPRLPCFVLDSAVRNPDFFGRDEVMRDLENALLPSGAKFISSESTSTKYFALSGMGGLGKTEIATEFAFRHRQKFDAVFWVKADEVAKLDQSYSQIAQILGLETAAESTSQVVSKGLVKEWLSHPYMRLPLEGHSEVSSQAQATWLIIFDNADEPSIVADYWPVMGNGSVLITSRDPLAKTYYSTKVSGVDLEPFSDADGASLLQTLTLDEDVAGVAQIISRRLGGLPLAITQMAGIIRRQELSLPEFMRSYENDAERPGLHSLRYSTGGGTYSSTVSSVWRFDKLNPRPRSLLGTLAFLDPDCIEEVILGEWPMPLPTQEFFGKPGDYRAARTELLQTSLIKRNKERKELSIHRLVQDAVRAQMSAEASAQIFWNIVGNLATQWPSGRAAPSKKMTKSTPPKAHSVSEWPKRQTLYPHVLRLKQTWQELYKDEATVHDIQWAGLLADAAWSQFERGRTRNLDGFYDIAFGLCKRSDDPDKEALLVDICLGVAAIAAEANDHPTSRKFKEQALDFQLEYLQGTGMEDGSLSRCYCELAIALIQDREYDNAVENLLRGIEINTRIGAFSALAYANLGLVYIFREEYEAAEKILSIALAKQESLFGKMDSVSFRTGRVLYAFGNLRAAQGRLVESHEYHQMTLDQFRSTIGDNHHRTADICHKVAEHLIRVGQYKDAMSMIDQALKTWGLDPGIYQPEIARTTFLKGKLLQTLEKDDRADQLVRKATAIFWANAPNVLQPETGMRQPGSEDFDNLVTFWSR